MTTEIDKPISIDAPHADRTDPAGNRAAIEAAQRLQLAIENAGGPSEVARRAGIPLASLNRVRSGQEMKTGVLVALADATGVTLEWLAAGRGPMHPGVKSAAPPPPAPAVAFTPMNVDRLAEAIRRAQRLYTDENRLPTPHRFAQILLLIYDELREPEAPSQSSHDD